MWLVNKEQFKEDFKPEECENQNLISLLICWIDDPGLKKILLEETLPTLQVGKFTSVLCWFTDKYRYN